MHPDADHVDPENGTESEPTTDQTWDPYLVSTVDATRQSAEELDPDEQLSESIRVVVDEINTTATCRRAMLLKSRGRL
ncbi:MAG: hypothetical protein CL799_09070 [Chromatiales bacterium]|jgi:hypothetical protein|nr:hypothetical protein [Chromatiales bacterium]MDP6151488.1 hypothetical protein [Gammaproteobacteria bacterium]MDP7094021.1 hypothetical protein [Gammaproteobacteria bacterium]HJP04876.1 hypothetical protein [Gammaproteobacteria bacterium]